MALGYYVMNWAIERCVAVVVQASATRLLTRVFRNEYLNSKEGRLEFADSE
jgi:hypothetical protein